MSKPRDNRPLDGEASPDLKRVLDALRNDGPRSDEMQRMAQKLDAWLETPTAVPDHGQGLLARPLGKITLAVLASGALLALLPYLLRNSSAHEQPPESAAQQALAPTSSGTAPALRGGASGGTAPALAPPLAPAPQPAPTPQVAAQPAPADAPELTRGVRRAARRHSARAASRAPAERPSVEAVSPAVPLNPAVVAGTPSATESRDSATPAPPATSPVVSAATHATTDASQVAPAPRAEVASTRQAPDARAPNAEQATPIRRARELDEAGLLQRARQLSHEQPAEALRLLDEHKRRFAHGMLAPEREVLAIEILRGQERNSEARVRLNTFRAQYPDSVYLERLERR